MRKSRVILGLFAVALVAAFSVWSGQAQSDLVGQCPALVERAMAEADLNCSELDRNHACYGFNRVNSTFVRAMDEGVFDQPADRVGVADLQSIQTVPLSSEDGYWGVALMRLQANIPNTLPGQAVVFVLVGEVQMDNAVPAEQVAPSVEPIPLEVVPASGANVRSGPGTNTNVVGSVLAGTELATDGRSEDGSWLRVGYQDAPAWISRELVEAPGRNLDELPVVNEDLLTPMQAFTFQTGLGEPECSEAPPSVLVVQGPQNMTVDLTVNGAHIRLGSTILLRTLGAQPEGVNPPDDSTPSLMELIVLDGEATVLDEDGEPLLVVPERYMAQLAVNIVDFRDPDNYSEPQLLTEEMLAVWQGLTLISPNLLNYPITLSPQQDVPLSQGVSCPGLQPTSPLDGYSHGVNTFYWNGITNAEVYRINVYNEGGSLVGQGDVAAPNTSMNFDMSTANVGAGFTFRWEVKALRGGRVICTSRPAQMLREAPPPVSVIQPGPVCGDGICEGNESDLICPGAMCFYRCSADCP